MRKKYDVSKTKIFGSYARGDARPGSDLDIPVDFKERKSLLILVRLRRELSKALGVKVDLLTEGAIGQISLFSALL